MLWLSLWKEQLLHIHVPPNHNLFHYGIRLHWHYRPKLLITIKPLAIYIHSHTSSSKYSKLSLVCHLHEWYTGVKETLGKLKKGKKEKSAFVSTIYEKRSKKKKQLLHFRGKFDVGFYIRFDLFVIVVKLYFIMFLSHLFVSFFFFFF